MKRPVHNLGIALLMILAAVAVIPTTVSATRRAPCEYHPKTGRLRVGPPMNFPILIARLGYGRAAWNAG